MWIDTHCHPFHKSFAEDMCEMLDRARNAGIEAMISVGYNGEANRRSLRLAENNDDVWTSFGVHPCDCAEWDKEKVWINDNLQAEKVVAIGEAGLDYHHMKYPEKEQERVFREQIRMARDRGLPLLVHSRNAEFDTLRILLEEKHDKVVLHCFCYGLEFAERAWELGCFTAFGGVLTYPSAKELKEVVKRCPEELLLVETDCPYMAPQKYRRKKNEVANIVEVGRKVSELRGESLKHVEALTSLNAKKLFALDC